MKTMNFFTTYGIISLSSLGWHSYESESHSVSATLSTVAGDKTNWNWGPHENDTRSLDILFSDGYRDVSPAHSKYATAACSCSV